ncbi:MAG: thermonuclease family protein [Caulobacterales bacterium]
MAAVDHRIAARLRSRLTRLAQALLFAAFVCGCGPKAPKGLQAGERGGVIRVAPDGALALSEGLIVRLAGVDLAPPAPAPLPLTPTEKPVKPKEPLFRTLLMDQAMGREVCLFYDGRRRDMRGAATAQVFAKTEAGDWVWLQQALLIAGAARVRTTPNDRAAAAHLFAAERSARAKAIGLWADPRFMIRDAEDPAALLKETGTFVLVEGLVHITAKTKDRVFLNFGDDYQTDFTASIPEEAWSAWPSGAPDLLSLKGAHVRVRGVLEDRNGPSLELTHPEQLELLPAEKG